MGVIETARPSARSFLSGVFLQRKKDNTNRVILNLKKLNTYVVSRHFKMEHLETALALVDEGCYMASIDLRHAYYSCSQFKFEGVRYRYKVMPNGLCSAPRYFTCIMKAVTTFLRSRYNIALTSFLDDTLLVSRRESHLVWAIRLASETFKGLGFTIHDKKSILVPTTRIQYLGVVIDSVKMTVTLPEDKTNRLLATCQDVLHAKTLPIRGVAGLIGMLHATRFANPHAALFLKVLDREKVKALARNRGNFDRHMALSQKARRDICWWIDNIPTLVKALLPLPIDRIFYTDASLLGWGCFDPQTNVSYGESWDEQSARPHINVLELMAVRNTLRIFAPHLRGTHVLIRTDNTTTRQCINKQGSTRSVDCNEVTRDIWMFCLRREIFLTAEYCPGVENVEADATSRNCTDATEWSLQPVIFRRITKVLGHTDVDLFASDHNFKVTTYVSKRPSVYAVSRDAFNCSWKNCNGYFFPPFCLASRVLRKIQQDQATGILVLPNWPSQPWFTTLRRLMTTPSYTIQVDRNTLYLSHAQEQTHPLAGRLELIATRISPCPSTDRAFTPVFVELC